LPRCVAILVRMGLTTVVFVHGFNSKPAVWAPLTGRLKLDKDFPPDRYRFLTFTYPTGILQLSPLKRIPPIKDCGDELATYIRVHCADADALFLVGHSMGGLVIEAMLAAKLKGFASDLKRIRGVIQFSTPNRGSNMISDARSIFTTLTGENPQEKSLRTLDEDTDDILRDVERGILRATACTPNTCPISFQVFYGLEDKIVTKVSARGPFDDFSGLPGDHSSILNGGEDRDDDPDDLRYLALKDALLNPMGHPSIYEIKLLEVALSVEPVSREIAFQILDLDKPVFVTTDNKALRTVTFTFSDKNRCHTPYTQAYRSIDGYVQFISTSSQNEASAADMSTYRSEGKLYTYVFTPDFGDTFSMRLCIYNGFGDGERSWHNHMEPNAHYQRFRITLDLRAYLVAGYTFSPEPRLCYYPGDSQDHDLCAQRQNNVADSLPPLPGDSPWLRSWELLGVQGGVVDLVWDVKAPAAPSA
jgi:pimeloyl-ACP methyl ester carboxylesterase